MRIEERHKYIRILFSSIIIGLFALMFWPFFTPLLLAALFSFALENLVTHFSLKYRKRHWVTLFVLVIFFIFIASPLVVMTFKLVASIKEYSAIGFQNTQFYKLTEQLLASLTNQTQIIAKNFDFDTQQLPQFSDVLSKASSSLASYATDFITQIPQRTISIFVFIGGLYFFLTQSSAIKKFFLNLDLLTKNELNQLIQIVQRSTYLTLFASALIGILQASIIATFAYFCGFNEFLFVFIITFIFSLIPIIGAAPIAIFLALLSFIQGHSSASVSLIVASVIAGSLDNLIKPLILNASSDEIHPLVSLLALIGAIIMYGAPGLLLGPILTQLAFKITKIFFPISDSNQNVT